MDLDNHLRLTEYLFKVKDSRTVSSADDVAEALANRQVARLNPSRYDVKEEVVIYGKDGSVLDEVDSVVLRENGEVAKWGEVKNSLKSEKAKEAQDQILETGEN